MGILYNMKKNSNSSIFTADFRLHLSRCESRKDYLRLLQWVITYYVNPDNHKEHMIFSVLSVIYRQSPEAFFDYLKDMDSLEWEFVANAKILFETEYFNQDTLDKWKNDLLGNSIKINKTNETVNNVPANSKIIHFKQ